MKKDEIQAKVPGQMSTNDWLKEIAYQLAILNEPKIFEIEPTRGPEGRGKSRR